MVQAGRTISDITENVAESGERKIKTLRSSRMNTFNNLFLYVFYMSCNRKQLSLKFVLQKASK